LPCRPRAPRHLHSFPTRRSSDLPVRRPMKPGQRPPRPHQPNGRCTRVTLACRHLSNSLRAVLSRLLTLLQKLIASLALLLLVAGDRKSTRLNSSHVSISYAVFCL